MLQCNVRKGNSLNGSYIPVKAEIARLIELDEAKKQLEADIKSITEERSALEQKLLADFEAMGIDSIKSGGKTVYIQRQLWARASEGSANVFRAAGLDYMVKESVNTQTLSAYVRELDRDGSPVPPEIAAVTNVSEAFQLRTRKA
jgi:hypothetical protein